MPDVWDSTSASDIPSNAGAVAGYGNGWYAWSAADWNRFATKAKIVVSITAAWNGGHVLDCETGDATPAQCPGWIKMRRAAGLGRPCIYCNLSTQPLVVAACSAAGLVLGRDYSLWVAHYTGFPHVIGGASAVQYADPNAGSGGHYDVSNITDPTWLSSLGLADPPPTPPAGSGGNKMIAFRGDGTDRHDMAFLYKGGFIHAWSDSISGDAKGGIGEESFGSPNGETLVPGTAWIIWNGPTMMWGAQASDGSWWYGWGTQAQGNVSGWKRWYSFASDVPIIAGPAGAPGPPGPATLAPHDHDVATTTTGPAKPTA